MKYGFVVLTAMSLGNVSNASEVFRITGSDGSAVGILDRGRTLTTVKDACSYSNEVAERKAKVDCEKAGGMALNFENKAIQIGTAGLYVSCTVSVILNCSI